MKAAVQRVNLSTAVYIGVPVLVGAGVYYAYATRASRAKLESKKPNPLDKLLHLKQAGNQNYSRKNYEAALEFYNKGIELGESSDVDPEEVALLYHNRATCYEALGGNEELIIADLTKAIEKKKHYSKAYFRRAKAYRRMKVYDKAMIDAFASNILDKFQNQISLTLTDEIVHESSQLKAQEAMKTHQPDWPSNQTIKLYFSALTYDPIKEKLGVSRINSHNLLIPLFEEAKRPENDQDPFSLFVRGVCYSLMSVTSEANESFDKLLALGDDKCSRKLKASALLRKSSLVLSETSALSVEKDFKRMSDLFEQALELMPDNPDIYLHKSQSLALCDKLDEAMETLNKAIDLKEDFLPAIAQKLYFEFKIATRESLSKIQPMLDLLQEKVKENPDSVELLHMQAQILTELGYLEQADQILMDISKLDPTDVGVYTSRALLQVHLKSDTEEVVSLMKEALKLDPKMIFAYEFLGSMEMQADDRDGAIKTFQTALSYAQNETDYKKIFCLLDSSIYQKAATEMLNLQM